MHAACASMPTVGCVRTSSCLHNSKLRRGVCLCRVATNRTKSGWAVVKMWCVPVMKPLQQGLARCSPPRVFAQVKLLLAQHKVRVMRVFFTVCYPLASI